LVKDYYLYRWSAYLNYQLDCIANGTAPDWGKFGADMLRWEQAWSLNTTMYPTTASGAPPLATAQAMAAKYVGNTAANGYAAHPGMDSVELPPHPPRWAQVPNSAGMGATGDDCPFVAHGASGSLAACEASCDSTPNCNTVNWSPATPGDCVFRACADPSNPALFPAPGYTVFSNPAAAPQWVQVPGSTNKAAMGDDCPWVAKGPSTLAGCQAGCDAVSGCNAFNWNAGDCEWRSCVDPLHPVLSDYPGWTVYGNANAGKMPVITRAWHTDVAALAFLCDATPGCEGFNSNGKLTSNATTLQPAPGITFYVKGGAPPAVAEGAATVLEGGAEGAEVQAAKPAKKKLPPPPKSAAKRAAELRKRAATMARR
jgi:hypothetical protein